MCRGVCTSCGAWRVPRTQRLDPPSPLPSLVLCSTAGGRAVPAEAVCAALPAAAGPGLDHRRHRQLGLPDDPKVAARLRPGAEHPLGRGCRRRHLRWAGARRGGAGAPAPRPPAPLLLPSPLLPCCFPLLAPSASLAASRRCNKHLMSAQGAEASMHALTRGLLPVFLFGGSPASHSSCVNQSTVGLQAG